MVDEPYYDAYAREIEYWRSCGYDDDTVHDCAAMAMERWLDDHEPIFSGTEDFCDAEDLDFWQSASDYDDYD